MSKYRRVTFEDRCQIDALMQARWSIPKISSHLGFHRSTIYRELRRNFGFNSYKGSNAHQMARERYRRCRRPYKLKADKLDFVCEALVQGWSPDQISGRLRREKRTSVSHECIYQLVDRHPPLRPLLRRQRSRGAGRIAQQRSLKRGRLNIRERPQAANLRERRGDWERDGMYGAKRKQLLVCTDRKTRYTKIGSPKDQTSKEFGLKTLELIEATGKKAFTITNDNGSEFRGRALPITTYFCDPMKPQQRGTVENTIGLLRQWISRKTDLDRITDLELKKMEDRLNFRPRKCLNYRTPFEAFYNRKVALAI